MYDLRRMGMPPNMLLRVGAEAFEEDVWQVSPRSPEAGRTLFRIDQIITRMRAVGLECRQGQDIVLGKLGPGRFLSRKEHPSLN